MAERLAALEEDPQSVFHAMLAEILERWEWIEDPPGTLARVQERGIAPDIA